MQYQLTPGGVMAPIKPLAAIEDRVGDQSRDFAAAGKYSLYALERMLQSCTQQPPWRLRAALCAAYYDGKQIDEVKRWLLRAEDVDERVVNLVRPIVNSVLGQEARSRTDVRLEADSDEAADVAEVLSAKLKEAERETYAHQAVSNGYGSMTKKGLGWLHICRNSDPLAYPYRFEDVPIDEIWWDWTGQKGTRLDDRCRWLARMRMVDLDEVIAGMPQHRRVLEQAARGWDDPRFDSTGILGAPDEMELQSAYENESRFNVSFRKWDWFDSARHMVKLIEVWYRVPAMVVVMKLGPTKSVLFNPKDERHREAVARGLVQLVKGSTSQVRRALYAGPHRLMDEATTRKRFPYVPMFAYRDDADGSPYGMIDGMIAPQDDYNDRRHSIQWMMKARQLTVDNDALDTNYNSIADIADNINRPDLVAVLNAHRRNPEAGFRITNSLQMQREQFDMLGMSETDVQKSAGRYSSQLGDAKVQSGVANSLLIEQGEQAMGEMNDNYVYARREAFDQLVDLIREDHMKPDMKVPLGQGRSRRVVVLNTWVRPTMAAPGPNGQPIEVPDPNASPVPTNMVAEADVVTGLAEVPNTPSYRMQTQQQLKEVITALAGNPPALAAITPAYIESTTLPNRQEVADDLRRATGQPLPGDKEGRKQAEAQQQATLAEQNQLAKEKALSEIEGNEADSELKKAQTAKTAAEAEMLRRQLQLGHAEVKVASDAASAQAAAGMNDNPEDDAEDAALQEATGAVA